MKKKQGNLFIGGPLDGQWRVVPSAIHNVQTAHFPPWNPSPVVDPTVIGTQTFSYDLERLRDGGGKVYEVYVCRHIGVSSLEQLIQRYPKKRKPEDPYKKISRRVRAAAMKRHATMLVDVFNKGGYKQEYEQLQRNTADGNGGADNPAAEIAKCGAIRHTHI